MQPPKEFVAHDGNSSASNNSNGTRPSLIAGARRGECVAWQRLVEYYQPRLFAKCRRLGLNEAAADDVLQNVWVAVSQSLPKLSSSVGRGTFRAWLWRITQRRIVDFQRKQRYEPTGAGGSTMLGRLLSLPADCDANPTDSQDSCSKVTSFTSNWQPILDRISVDYHPKTWQAFLRNTIDGCSTVQVAEEFNISVVNVRQLRSRILRRLRKELES